jgi:hypothetical protein
MRVLVYKLTCLYACVRAYVRVFVCVRVYVRACVCACVRVRVRVYSSRARCMDVLFEQKQKGTWQRTLLERRPTISNQVVTQRKIL